MASKFKRGVAVGFLLGLGSAAALQYAFTEQAGCAIKASVAQAAASTKDLGPDKIAIVDSTCTVRILDKAIVETAPSIDF